MLTTCKHCAQNETMCIIIFRETRFYKISRGEIKRRRQQKQNLLCFDVSLRLNHIIFSNILIDLEAVFSGANNLLSTRRTSLIALYLTFVPFVPALLILLRP
jgi:hypothetical protein